MPNLTKQEVTTQTQNWNEAMSSELASLFSFIHQHERYRYDTFTIDVTDFGAKIATLNTPPNASMIANNISTVGVCMGVKEENNIKTFSPILQINLNEAIDGQMEYYYNFNPVKDISDAFIDGHLLMPDSKISTEIAELFILKWHCLSDNEIIKAFETVTTNKIAYYDTEQGRKAFTELGPQKMFRVKSYQYDEIKTQQLISQIISYENDYQNADLILHTGAGLQVNNFHPFNFRPVLKVHAVDSATSSMLKKNTYFDTSRPCPPFCPAVAITS